MQNTRGFMNTLIFQICTSALTICSNCLKKCFKKKNKSSSSDCNEHLYNISHDILKLRYEIANKPHYICVSRFRTLSEIQNIYSSVTSLSSSNLALVEYPIMLAKLNNKTDVTDKVNAHLGFQACHLQHGEKLRVRYLLESTDIDTFKQLTIFTNDFQKKEYLQLDDVIDV